MSKFDELKKDAERCKIAGNIMGIHPQEVGDLLAIQAQLVAALQDMLSEKADYMTRNKLGDPAFETVSIRAMAALSAAGVHP